MFSDQTCYNVEEVLDLINVAQSNKILLERDCFPLSTKTGFPLQLHEGRNNICLSKHVSKHGHNAWKIIVILSVIFIKEWNSDFGKWMEGHSITLEDFLCRKYASVERWEANESQDNHDDLYLMVLIV